MPFSYGESRFQASKLRQCLQNPNISQTSVSLCENQFRSCFGKKWKTVVVAVVVVVVLVVVVVVVVVAGVVVVVVVAVAVAVAAI